MISYSQIIKDNGMNDISNKNDDEITPGWTIIKYNNNRSNIDIIDSKQTKITKENYKNIKQKKVKANIINANTKMINNWNAYRNKDIELYGDRSQYYNYYVEVENIINEEYYINKLINDYNDANIESDSDEENNKHLIY